jgi:hypothetical protein
MSGKQRRVAVKLRAILREILGSFGIRILIFRRYAINIRIYAIGKKILRFTINFRSGTGPRK